MSTSAMSGSRIAQKGDSDRVMGDILTDRICDFWLGLDVSYLIVELCWCWKPGALM